MRSFSEMPGGFFAAHNCTITGEVNISPERPASGLTRWFAGMSAPITIGRRVNVQDGAVVHCDSGIANTIEDDVTIGHRAIVHGAHVGKGSLIGMGAVLLGRTKIGSECLIAAGSGGVAGIAGAGSDGRDGRAGEDRPAESNPKNSNTCARLTTHYVELRGNTSAEIERDIPR